MWQQKHQKLISTIFISAPLKKLKSLKLENKTSVESENVIPDVLLGTS